MASYYDIVLGLIPVSLVGLTALLFVAGMSLSASIPLASIVTAGLIGHAMFVNAPVDSAPGAASQPSSTETNSGRGQSPSESGRQTI